MKGNTYFPCVKVVCKTHYLLKNRAANRTHEVKTNIPNTQPSPKDALK